MLKLDAYLSPPGRSAVFRAVIASRLAAKASEGLRLEACHDRSIGQMTLL